MSGRTRCFHPMLESLEVRATPSALEIPHAAGGTPVVAPVFRVRIPHFPVHHPIAHGQGVNHLLPVPFSPFTQPAGISLGGTQTISLLGQVPAPPLPNQFADSPFLAFIMGHVDGPPPWAGHVILPPGSSGI